MLMIMYALRRPEDLFPWGKARAPESCENYKEYARVIRSYLPEEGTPTKWADAIAVYLTAVAFHVNI